MGSLLTRPFSCARAIVAAVAGAGTGAATSGQGPKSSPKTLGEQQQRQQQQHHQARGATTPRPAPARVPSWLTSPRRRLRWLYARICSERRDRVVRFGSSPFRPDPAEGGYRPRSFREILGRKLLEAEDAGARGRGPGLPLAELLERVAENLFLMAWWKGEWLCYALVWWAFRALVPARWQWLSATPWWWGDAVCAWWAEVLVARPGDGGKLVRHPSLRKVWLSVGRGDAVIVAAAGRGSPDRWGVISGRLDDLVELTRVLCEISWCFVCFYLWAAKTHVLAYPRCVARSVCKALGVDVPRCRLDIELLELD